MYGSRGPAFVTKVLLRAIARSLKPDCSLLSAPLDLNNVDDHSDKYQELERDTEAWHLPRASDQLGQLVVSFPDIFGRTILTTNFDPLIHISIRKHGGQAYYTVLQSDGNLQQTFSDGTHIVHLHGYWRGSDTLHTPQQLTQPRPLLKHSLARLIASSTLVVVGYGGWDDVISHTLTDLIADLGSTPDILWTFHENDDLRIQSTQSALLSSHSSGIHRGRVSLYKGVNCQTLFSDLLAAFRNLRGDTPYVHPPTSLPSSAVPDIVSFELSQRPRSKAHTAHPRLAHTAPEPDSPLFIAPWVGRSHELAALRSANNPLIFITGIGGQGKSALAGRLVQEAAIENADYQLWDWRDCREESDRLSTQLLRLIERLSDGFVDVGRIDSIDVEAVIAILFRFIGDKRILFVFDNVDQYVDLETMQLVKGLDLLVSEIQTRAHRCTFVFTCRPDVDVSDERSLVLPLQGFSEQETGEFIKARGVQSDELHLAKDLYNSTKGHPLRMNLIILRAVWQKVGLQAALQQLPLGGDAIPQSVKTSWDALNERQQQVLRTMAELDRPEPEEHIEQLINGINFNRLHRTLRTLHAYHLVEVRAEANGTKLFGLHPIIRDFVRTNFPKKDREKYIGTILTFFEENIRRFRHILGQEPAFTILEYWVRKAELQITFGRYEEAVETISDVAGSLANRGYSEELVRIVRYLLSRCDWAVACSMYKDFDAVFHRSLTQMIQMGHEGVDELLRRFEEAIPGRSAQYILLCDLRCYEKWYVGEHEAAISWGEEGESLKKRSAVDTGFSSKHNLALALRDGGRLSDAMTMFLAGRELKEVLAAREEEGGEHASFYGNLGRCLFFKGDLGPAEQVYLKSAAMLEKGRGQIDRLNRGYIRFWVGELALAVGNEEEAAASFRAAQCVWNDVSPPRAKEAEARMKRLQDANPELARYGAEAADGGERRFRKWMDGRSVLPVE